MRNWMTIAVAVALSACLWIPGSAEAKSKGKKDPCSRADQRLLRTGVGDADADGVSDCRESQLLKTDPQNPDTDDDGLDDGDDFAKSCDPKDEDTDDDGVPDGDDETPVVTQKMVALLDALTCPTPEVPGTPKEPTPLPEIPGSISALGTTAAVGTDTSFGRLSCDNLVTLFELGEGNLLVEIKILENALGELNATSVTLVRGCRRPDHHHSWPRWWDHDDDEDDDD